MITAIEGAKIQVHVGKEFIYHLNVVDAGDNFTFSVVFGDFEQKLEAVDDNLEQYIFKLTVKRLTNDPLMFVANDSQGAVSCFTPIVEVCACANGGKCTTDGLITSNSTIIMRCLCDDGKLNLCTCNCKIKKAFDIAFQM